MLRHSVRQVAPSARRRSRASPTARGAWSPRSTRAARAAPSLRRQTSTRRATPPPSSRRCCSTRRAPTSAGCPRWSACAACGCSTAACACPLACPRSGPPGSTSTRRACTAPRAGGSRACGAVGCRARCARCSRARRRCPPPTRASTSTRCTSSTCATAPTRPRRRRSLGSTSKRCPRARCCACASLPAALLFTPLRTPLFTPLLRPAGARAPRLGTGRHAARARGHGARAARHVRGAAPGGDGRPQDAHVRRHRARHLPGAEPTEHPARLAPPARLALPGRPALAHPACPRRRGSSCS